MGLDDGARVPLRASQVGVDLNRATGNFVQTRASARLSHFERWGDVAAALGTLKYTYMKNGDLLFNDDLRAFTLLTAGPLRALQLNVLGLYHSNYARFVEARWMGGAGVAWAALRSASHQLKPGVSLAYEHTRFDDRAPRFAPPGAGGACAYQAPFEALASCERRLPRVIPRLVGYSELLARRLVVSYEALLVVDPLQTADRRLYLSATALVPITDWLKVSAHYDLTHETVTLTHRQRLDTTLSFGLTVSSSDAHKGL
ncbi:MAG: DUF481 domain-containing protein [Deltaproteobacteria bacterium]|nr:DUF481 domain-containing protein [Deltaproteobacteria bacterium]